MNIQLLDNELSVFEDDADLENDCELLNYYESLAGHTLIIGDDFELIEDKSGERNAYIIKRREK